MLEKEQWWKKTITFNDLSQTKTWSQLNMNIRLHKGTQINQRM